MSDGVHYNFTVSLTDVAIVGGTKCVLLLDVPGDMVSSTNVNQSVTKDARLAVLLVVPVLAMDIGRGLLLVSRDMLFSVFIEEQSSVSLNALETLKDPKLSAELSIEEVSERKNKDFLFSFGKLLSLASTDAFRSLSCSEGAGVPAGNVSGSTSDFSLLKSRC
jgi:hypothetical protein